GRPSSHVCRRVGANFVTNSSDRCPKYRAPMKRFAVVLAVFALTAVCFMLWLTVTRGGIRGGVADTAPLAEWLVALATGGLAVGTLLVAREARNEAKAVHDEAEQVKRQVEIEA